MFLITVTLNGFISARPQPLGTVRNEIAINPAFAANLRYSVVKLEAFFLHVTQKNHQTIF